MPCFVVVAETPIERMMKCTSNSKFTMGITTHKIRPWTCTHQARGCNNDRCQFKAALAQLPFPRMQQLTWPETCLKSTSPSHPSKPAPRRCRMFLRLSRAPCILQRQPNRPYLSHLRHNKPSQSKHRSFFGWSLECWFETYRVILKIWLFTVLFRVVFVSLYERNSDVWIYFFRSHSSWCATLYIIFIRNKFIDQLDSSSRKKENEHRETFWWEKTFLVLYLSWKLQFYIKWMVLQHSL